MGLPVALLALLLLCFPARADEPGLAWWSGAGIANVSLEAGEGSLPLQDLRPLLRATPGDRLDPTIVSLDVTTLFRVGGFAAVEADLKPWPYEDENGDIEQGAYVTYIVYPAPRVHRVFVQGNQIARDRDLLLATGLATDDTFFADLDVPRVEARVRSWLVNAGFPEASVEVSPTELSGNRLEIWIRVDEGRPRTLNEVRLEGDLPLTQRRLRTLARRSGLKPGKPLAADAVLRAQLELRKELARPNTELIQTRRGRGYVEADIDVIEQGLPDGTVDVVIRVDPGPRLVLRVEGLGFRGRKQVIDALGVDERLRLTRGFLEQAPEILSEYYRRRGFYAVQAEVSLESSAAEHVLRIDVDRGTRHRLTWVGFEFPDTDEPAVRPNTLRTVMNQASRDVIRRNRLTEAELAKAITALEGYYGSLGYQDARIERKAIDIGYPDGKLPGRWWRNLQDAIIQAWPLGGRLPMHLHLTISEGPATRLSALQIDGAAPDVDLGFADDARAKWVGGPYSPQAIAALARRLAEEHRASGYLDTDVRVENVGQEGAVAVILDVRPGPQVRLRSLSTRGNRHVSSRYIRRAVGLEIGQVLTTDTLDEIRGRLYDLGTFGSVTVQVLGDDVARDVIIQVSERPRFGVEGGVGVATDQGLRAFGRLTSRNLPLSGMRLELYGLAGLEWKTDSLVSPPDIADPDWRLVLTATVPHRPWRDTELVFEAIGREETQERAFRIARAGGSAHIATVVGPTRVELRFGGRFEARRLEELDLGTLLANEHWARFIRRPDDLPTVWRAQEELEALVVARFPEDPATASEGVAMSARVAGAPGIPYGRKDRTVAHLRTEGRINAHFGLGPLQVRLSGEAGHIRALTPEDIPVEERYRLGGTASLRGFRRDAVGPRNLVDQLDLTTWPEPLRPAIAETLADDPLRWVPTGGDTKGVAIAELLVPLPVLGLTNWDGYALAVFADIGNVWLLNPGSAAGSRSVYNPVVRYGVGLGLRFQTALGPFQADVAANPASLAATGERRTLLRDDWDEPPFRLHLSLGSLF